MLFLKPGVAAMKSTIAGLVLLGALAVPAAARAADEDKGWTWEEEGTPLAAAEEQPQATPQSAAPSTPAPPPPTPAERPAPPQPSDERATGGTTGQWVYTQQYGWVWMPYADDFLYVPPYGPPYAYLYYPLYGWTWVVAPWIYGWGPWPFFGFYGAVHYGWYGRGWWREPWRWRSYPPAGWGHYPYYRPSPGRPGARPGYVRPSPGRSGSGPTYRASPGRVGGGAMAPAPAPATRSGPGRR